MALVCCPVQWCVVILTITCGLLLSALLTQVLNRREVTILCCPEQWYHAMLPRLQIHLRSLHHSLHNVQFSSLGHFHKALMVRHVLQIATDVAAGSIKTSCSPQPRASMCPT